MTLAIPAVATPAAHAESTSGRRLVARAMWIGLWVWPAFLVLDLYMCFVAYPEAPFGVFVAYRLAVELAFFAVYRATRRGFLDLKRLYWLQNLVYGSAALVIALMSVHLGGIRSPYMHGISIVALVRAALVPTHWRHGIKTYGRIALAFPLVMGATAFILPAARREWINRESLIVFASNYVFVLASSFLGLVTGHIVWSTQQQLYRARRVGRYRLQAPIGKGGMGEVWLAWDQSLSRNVALKILRVGSASSPESVRRFELEAQAAGRLRGPHVAQIFDFGASDDGLYYIAMEYLSGLNLAQLIEKFGPLPPTRAVRIAMQICEALDEAHAAGVIHRDLKPHNLFLTYTPEEPDFVKLLDFGIARLSTTESECERLTWTGVMVGTPAFLAPELWRGAEADARSDIYALAVTLHVLLTGVTPFDGLAVEQLRRTQLTGAPPALRDPPDSSIDSRLASVLRRCLEPDPSLRVQSARELRSALEACCDPVAWTREQAEGFWKRLEKDRFG